MPTTSVIDLGVMPPADTDFEAELYPTTMGARWRRAFACVVLLPLFCTVAAVAAIPPLRQIGTIVTPTQQSFQLFDDGLYLVDGRQSLRGSETVSAYSPEGGLRWVRTVPGWAPETRVYETADETVINAADLGGPTEFLVVDRKSGRQRWVGHDLTAAGQPYVLAVQPSPGRALVDVIDVGHGANELYWLSTRTGAVFWKFALPTGWRVNVVGEPAGPVYRILGQDGELLEVDLSDAGGHRLVRLPDADSVSDPLRRALTVGNDAVIVSDAGPSETVVHSYDPETYQLRWERAFTGAVTVQPCGPDLCVQNEQALNAIDPRTGVVWWQSSPAVIYPVGAAMIAQTSTRFGVEPPMLLDALSGRRLANLDTWQVLAVSGNATAFMMRPLTDRSGLWLGRLDAGAASVQVLAAVPDLSDNCSATGVYLACQLSGGTIVIWRTS